MTAGRRTNVHFSLWVLFSTIFFAGCHTKGPAEKSDSTMNKPKLVFPSDAIPEYRKIVKTEPVAEYKEKIIDPLNDWYFSVRIYETSKTFRYLLRLQFEEIEGEDTLKLPNFGTEPKPSLVTGKEKYSCVIGFFDKRNIFKEYKFY